MCSEGFLDQLEKRAVHGGKGWTSSPGLRVVKLALTSAFESRCADNLPVVALGGG